MLEFKTPPEIGWLFLALFGGLAKFFDAYLNGEEGATVWRFFALMVVSGFSGYMTALMVMLYDPKFVTVAAGIGGFAGTKIIEILMDAARLRLGVFKKEKSKE